jgi:hypothetical protein
VRRSRTIAAPSNRPMRSWSEGVVVVVAKIACNIPGSTAAGDAMATIAVFFFFPQGHRAYLGGRLVSAS